MKTIVSEISDVIKKGDLIIIGEYGCGLNLGFFLGRGQGGSMQYYTFSRLLYWKEKYNGKRKSPYVNYINSPHPTRIAKYHPDCIENKKMKEKYERALEIMKELKIIEE